MKKEYEIKIPEEYLDGIPLKTDLNAGENWGKYKKKGPVVFFKNNDNSISVIKFKNIKWPEKIEVDGLGIINFKGAHNFAKEKKIKEFVFFPIEKTGHSDYMVVGLLLLISLTIINSKKHFANFYEKMVFKRRIKNHLEEQDFIKVRNIIMGKEGEKYKKYFTKFIKMFEDQFWSPTFDKKEMKDNIIEAINEL